MNFFEIMEVLSCADMLPPYRLAFKQRDLDGAPLPVGFGGLRDTFSEETMPVPPLQ